MIVSVLRGNLLAIANAYAKATGATIGGVSKKFYGHSDFLPAFKTGAKSVSLDKYEEMIEAFREVWPEGADWPMLRALVIPRPKKKFIPKSRKPSLLADAANQVKGGHHEPTPG